MKSLTKSDISAIVIGGGASGMLAAGIAAGHGEHVLLIEKNPILGKKLGITGKGRCNVTNDCTDDEFFENIPQNKKFIYSAFSKFGPSDVIEFFENLGVPLKKERGGRVFPNSENARDIVFALKKFVLQNGAEILERTTAKRILTQGGKVRGVLTDRGEYVCDRVILATGGLSYPGTGSTGDGYDMARELGHTVTELRPSLVPLEIKQDFCEKMQGLSLRNVKLRIYDEKNKLIFSDFGEMMFTHFGVTGPLVLSASAHIPKACNTEYFGLIDLKPALDEKTLNDRILRDFSEMRNKNFINSLDKLLHKTMIPVVVDESKIPPETKVNSITRQQRMTLLEIIKNFRIDILGTRPVSEAIITSGGISTAEITPATMESKIVKGLYFAGEIIDIDAYTGGFNLQIAWSTGFAAGNGGNI